MAMTQTYTGPERRMASSSPHAVGHHATGHRMNALDWISTILMIIGGLNWGLVGLADVNVVAALFGEQSALSRLIYVLVGLASLYGIYMLMKMASRNDAS